MQPEERKKCLEETTFAGDSKTDCKPQWRPSNVDEAGPLLVELLRLEDHSCGYESGKNVPPGLIIPKEAYDVVR